MYGQCCLWFLVGFVLYLSDFSVLNSGLWVNVKTSSKGSANIINMAYHSINLKLLNVFLVDLHICSINI